MKKIIFILAFLIGIISSCSKTDIQKDIQNEKCVLSINPVGEITTSENPLTKSSYSRCYLVQVNQNDTSYMMGLFSSLNGLKVFLHKGLRYTFKISAIYDVNVETINSSSSFSSSLSPNINVSSYDFICTMYNNGTWYNQKFKWNVGTGDPKVGTSYYSAMPPISFYKQFKFPNIGKAIIQEEQNPINLTDWFYGEATFTPNGQYETLDMNFKRVGYKLKYELSGVTDGEVTVTLKTQSGKVLIQNTTNTETYSGDAIFVPYYDIASVYQNPSSYFENLIVSVSWLRGIGVTQDLGSTTIQVKRNNLNRVRISLGNSDSGAAMNLSTEAESMGTESTDITVE